MSYSDYSFKDLFQIIALGSVVWYRPKQILFLSGMGCAYLIPDMMLLRGVSYFGIDWSLYENRLIRCRPATVGNGLIVLGFEK